MEKNFYYDQTHNFYVSREDANYKIKQTSEIRYKLDQIKYDKGDFVSIFTYYYNFTFLNNSIFGY